MTEFMNARKPLMSSVSSKTKKLVLGLLVLAAASGAVAACSFGGGTEVSADELNARRDGLPRITTVLKK